MMEIIFMTVGIIAGFFIGFVVSTAMSDEVQAYKNGFHDGEKSVKGKKR